MMVTDLPAKSDGNKSTLHPKSSVSFEGLEDPSDDAPKNDAPLGSDVTADHRAHDGHNPDNDIFDNPHPDESIYSGESLASHASTQMIFKIDQTNRNLKREYDLIMRSIDTQNYGNSSSLELRLKARKHKRQL